MQPPLLPQALLAAAALGCTVRAPASVTASVTASAPASAPAPAPASAPASVTASASASASAPASAPAPAPAPAPCPAPLDVRDFGAGLGAPEGDAPAFQRAFDAARAQAEPCVRVPSGVYVVRRSPGQRLLDVPIRPEIDGLTLFGAPDGSSRIVLEADAPALLVNKGDRSPPEPVRGLTLRDLVFEAPGGHGLSDMGLVQLNHCPGLRAAGLVIRMDARAQVARGIKMDGLATSQGTSGLLERILVDGASKTGLYVASGTHDLMVRGSETRGAWSAPPVNAPTPGIGVSDAHRITILDHHAHQNQGDGLLIATNGLPPVRVAGMQVPDPGAIGPRPPAHGPATGVRVIGGSFSHNGEAGGSGIRIASGFLEVPRDIDVQDALVRGNAGAGILVEAGERIAIGGAVVIDNGAQGILVRDVVLPGQATDTSRTAGVRILDALIHGNGRAVHVDVAGLEVRGRAERVSLIGGVIAAGGEGSRQREGFRLIAEGERACRGFSTGGWPRIAAPIPSSEGAP